MMFHLSSDSGGIWEWVVLVTEAELPECPW
jgi:hypothetical protein